MVPSGRKHSGKSAKPSMGDQAVRIYEFEQEDKKDLSGSEEDAIEEKTLILEKRGRKRNSAVVEDMGGEVQNMLERFGADINKSLLAKRKRLEMYTKASLKTSNQKLENVWKTQQEQRQKLNQEYSEQFLTLFQQWDMDMQKAEEQEEKLANLFRQQQKVFQQSRIVQSQRLKTIRQLYEQFIKNMEHLEKNHENLLTGAQNELKKRNGFVAKKNYDGNCKLLLRLKKKVLISSKRWQVSESLFNPCYSDDSLKEELEPKKYTIITLANKSLE